MLKNVLKFLGIALGIVLIGAGALFGVQYWRYRTSPEYKALQDIKELERRYAEDSYGGETPEETLRLFIDALKRGNTELAAKYFVLDKQEQWREDLAKIQEKGLLDEMVRDLEAVKLTGKDEDRAFFTLVDKNNMAIAELIMHRNSSNKRWKITEL